MYKTTALMLSLMLTSMPVLADCMAQLNRKTVAEQLSRSIDYLGPLPSDLNCVKPTSAAMALVCGNADLLALHHLNRYASLHHRRMCLQKLCTKLPRRRRLRFQTVACFVNKLAWYMSILKRPVNPNGIYRPLLSRLA